MSCLTGESVHDRFGGGIDAWMLLEDLFRVMVRRLLLLLLLRPLLEPEKLDVVELVMDPVCTARL